MASTNMFDLLNDDAQDQEIKVPAVAKATPSKPAAKATPAAGGASGANRSAGGDNRGPRKDAGAGGARQNRPRPANNDPNEASRLSPTHQPNHDQQTDTHTWSDSSDCVFIN
ncbi:hypothetical protein K457DRAFT_878765 [Linnemannia elongata AG-77]|uniref:STM1-like N-terminal domain-containing protein n=1 Tax=Linnemannia elongata AG-77 TaxID=1314771 RepID=A0A197JHA4_9FUNG|nr:hypothetical protein K457DRAFT_878765 [Linnemannia elongata AG-77]